MTTNNNILLFYFTCETLFTATIDLEKHSIEATKKAIAKKAFDVIFETNGAKKEDYSDFETIKKDFIKNITKKVEEGLPEGCHFEHLKRRISYKGTVEVAPVAKRTKKTYSINIFRYNRQTNQPEFVAYEMEKYNTKVECLKSLPLFIRKDEATGHYYVTEATTGFKVADARKKKDLELDLQRLVDKLTFDGLMEKLNETIEQNGCANPEYSGVATKKEEAPVVEAVEAPTPEVAPTPEHGPEKEKEAPAIEFKPELTAIDTNNSKSAELVASMVDENSKVLDYGCGTGRNIRYIVQNSSALLVDGTDIPEQLEKESDKHIQLEKESNGKVQILEPERTPDNYDIVLNSHVLNVIESDKIKEEVIKDIYNRLVDGGKAIIEVRTKSDVESSKTKIRHGDGWRIKKGKHFTYQEAITKEKMQRLLTSAGFKIEEHIYNASKHILIANK